MNEEETKLVNAIRGIANIPDVTFLMPSADLRTLIGAIDRLAVQLAQFLKPVQEGPPRAMRVFQHKYELGGEG